MSFNHQSVKKKSNLVIGILIFVLITVISIIFSLLINPFWLILLPISFFVLIILRLMSHYFWLEEKTCLRCNAPVGKYSEFCRNCGQKLWFKCLSCGKYMPADTKFCDNCNIELEHTVHEKETFDYEVLEKGSPLPVNPNFCANCGAKLNNIERLKFCEECGEKI